MSVETCAFAANKYASSHGVTSLLPAKVLICIFSFLRFDDFTNVFADSIDALVLSADNDNDGDKLTGLDQLTQEEEATNSLCILPSGIDEMCGMQ